MLFQRIVSVTAKCTINVIDCIQEVFITSVFSPGLSCECFVGIRVREILVPEREREGGGGGGGRKYQSDNLFFPPHGPYRRWGL